MEQDAAKRTKRAEPKNLFFQTEPKPRKQIAPASGNNSTQEVENSDPPFPGIPLNVSRGFDDFKKVKVLGTSPNNQER